MSEWVASYRELTQSVEPAGFFVNNGEFRQLPAKIFTHEVESPEIANAIAQQSLLQKQVTHPSILSIYDVGCFPVYSGKFRAVVVTDVFSEFLSTEIDRRAAERRAWCESELIAHLSGLVSAIQTAAHSNLFSAGISPLSVVVSGEMWRLHLSWSWCLQPAVQQETELLRFMCEEQARASYAGDQNGYNCEKAEVYAIAAVVLSAAALELKGELHTLLTGTKAQYPRLTDVLEKMLCPETSRATCEEVLESIYGSCNPDAAVPPACNICHSALGCSDWQVDLPADLRHFADIYSEFCSQRCLRMHAIFSVTRRKEMKCLKCPSVIPFEQAFSSPAILLACGHGFESRACFMQHLEGARGGDFVCSSCNSPIEREFIVAKLGLAYYERMQIKSAALWCNGCFMCKAKYGFRACEHRLCKSCLTGQKLLRSFWPSQLPCIICEAKKSKQ